MLSKKDKEWIQEEISQQVERAINKALTIKMHWQKVRDEKTGIPLAESEDLWEDVFLPSFFVQHIKFHEGAFRGMQEDTNRANNRANETHRRIESMGQTLLSMEGSVKTIARFALALRNSGLLEQMEKALLTESTPQNYLPEKKGNESNTEQR